MSEVADRLKGDAEALEEIAAALEWVGGVGNSETPGSGDEALANAETLKGVAAFVRSVAATA